MNQWCLMLILHVDVRTWLTINHLFLHEVNQRFNQKTSWLCAIFPRNNTLLYQCDDTILQYTPSITDLDLKSGWCLIIYKTLYLFGSNNSCYLSSWGVIVSYISRSANLIFTSIFYVGYLCPSNDKFIMFSRHYSYHGLTKDLIRIFIVTLWHIPNSLKNFM
jgi:hypothetical protein